MQSRGRIIGRNSFYFLGQACLYPCYPCLFMTILLNSENTALKARENLSHFFSSSGITAEYTSEAEV